MIGLTSTMSRSVVIAVGSQPPLAVLRPLNSHQQYHRCQEQHRSTDYRSAHHKQSTSPPTCPRLQVVFFQPTRCACWQFSCARRARRAGARASRCAPWVYFLSVQLRMKVTFLPPLCPAPPTSLICARYHLARTINTTGEDRICVQSS